MARNKVFLFILPVVGLVTITGTGFAAWYFTNEQADSKNVSGTVIVENEFQGTLAVKNNLEQFKIKLDQGSVNSSNLDEGISIVQSNNLSTQVSEIKATYTIDTTNQTTFNDAGNLKLTLKAEFKFNTTLLKYVEVKDDAFTPTQDSDTTKKFTLVKSKAETTDPYDNVYTISKEYTNLTETSYEFGASTAMNSKANALLKYKTHSGSHSGGDYVGKPTTSDEYSDMKDAISGVSGNLLDIKFTVTVADR